MTDMSHFALEWKDPIGFSCNNRVLLGIPGVDGRSLVFFSCGISTFYDHLLQTFPLRESEAKEARPYL